MERMQLTISLCHDGQTLHADAQAQDDEQPLAELFIPGVRVEVDRRSDDDLEGHALSSDPSWSMSRATRSAAAPAQYDRCRRRCAAHWRSGH